MQHEVRQLSRESTSCVVISIPYSGRGHCYVDGPLFEMRGTTQQRVRSVGRVVLLWAAFGLPIPLTKTQLWIAGSVDRNPVGKKLRDRAEITVPAEILVELKGNTAQLVSVRVIAYGELTSYK